MLILTDIETLDHLVVIKRGRVVHLSSIQEVSSHAFSFIAFYYRPIMTASRYTEIAYTNLNNFGQDLLL